MNKVTNDIYYVGVNDHQVDLFEGQYVVPNGMAYNSYVIKDDLIAVMDTVDAHFTDQWLINIKEVLDRLKPFICDKPILKDEIKNSDLYRLGLYGNEKIRSYVCQKLQLGKCNCKTLYKRLILNNISLNKLCEIIEEYNHGN